VDTALDNKAKFRVTTQGIFHTLEGLSEGARRPLQLVVPYHHRIVPIAPHSPACKPVLHRCYSWSMGGLGRDSTP